MNYPYSKIVEIRRCSCNVEHPFCITIRVGCISTEISHQTRKGAFWFSWKSETEVTEWYDNMQKAWRECHEIHTRQPFTMRITDENGEVVCKCQFISWMQISEMDPDLSIIFGKIRRCQDQDSLKTYLIDVEGYQNGNPIEVVIPQKALQDFFKEK